MLDDIRAELAQGWDTLLIPQDRNGYRPHVTLLNRVTAKRAKAAMDALSVGFQPFVTRSPAIAVWRYLEGPWEMLGQVAFRGR